MFENHLGFADRNRRLGMVLAGVMAVVVALTLYLLCSGALLASYKMVYRNFVYSRYYAIDMGWTIPRSFWGTLEHSFQRLWKGYSQGIPFLPFVPLYLAFLWRWRSNFFLVVNLVGIAAAFIAISMGQCFFEHYFQIGLIALMQPAIYGAVYVHQDIKKHVRWLWVVIVLVSMVLLLWQVVPALKRERRPIPRFKMDIQVPVNLQRAVAWYTTRDDYILSNVSPDWQVILDRRHSYTWAYMVDEYIRMYDGKDEADRLRRLKDEIGKKLPRIIYLDGSMIPRQIRHLNAVILPIMGEHRYRQLAPGLFVLPPVVKWEDTRSVQNVP